MSLGLRLARSLTTVRFRFEPALAAFFFFIGILLSLR